MSVDSDPMMPARLGHELRTPLTAILGFVELLEIDLPHDLGPQQRRWLTHIRSAGEQLLGLVDDMLDMARLERGQRRFVEESFCLEGAIAEAAAIVQLAARDARVTLHLPAGGASPPVHSDRRAVHQVLVNLLSNAVKYNRPDGIVHVSVERGDAVCVAVRDTGRGIAADDLPRLYRPFERLGAAGSDIPGTGLGLAISKRLAAALGGSIACVSQPGVGSTFTLRLPGA